MKKIIIVPGKRFPLVQVEKLQLTFTGWLRLIKRFELEYIPSIDDYKIKFKDRVIELDKPFKRQ